MTVWRWAPPLSSNKVDGCWLDYNPEIFVSAIICQVLSTITSISDIGARITHYPAWVLTTNQIGDCHDPSAKLLHRCQSPSSAQHFSQISLILSKHFCGRDNISECVIITHIISHQAAARSINTEWCYCLLVISDHLWLVTCHNGGLWLADAGHMSLPAHLVMVSLWTHPLYLTQTSVLVTPRNFRVTSKFWNIM